MRIGLHGRQTVVGGYGYFPRISTAITLGGGAEGIGLDGAGLGETGVSGISTGNCNDQGDHQREDLDGEHHDSVADAAG